MFACQQVTARMSGKMLSYTKSAACPACGSPYRSGAYPDGNRKVGFMGVGTEKARHTPKNCLMGFLSHLDPRVAGVFYIRMNLERKI